MGPGVLNFVYPTELFPSTEQCALSATGFGTAVSRVGAILAILVFPHFVHDWGLPAVLWLFVFTSALGLVICIALARRRSAARWKRSAGSMRRRRCWAARRPCLRVKG